MARYLFSCFSVSWVWLFFSCSDAEIPDPDLDFDYQPLEVGRYWIYEVSEELVFGEGDQETSSYFIRDLVDYKYVNRANEEVFVVKRQRSTDQLDWHTEKTYAMYRRHHTLVRKFDNQVTVNLVFPLELNRSWDAMVYNSSEIDEYKISLLGEVTVGHLHFPHSAKVLHEDADDQITFRNRRYEVFAWNVGLIEQYFEVLTYCSRSDCLGQMIVDSGRKIHLKIVAYGED